MGHCQSVGFYLDGDEITLAILSQWRMYLSYVLTESLRQEMDCKKAMVEAGRWVWRLLC